MISVILPIYNMQDYIEDCLKSVIIQSYKDIEIICVNDFSMDNSMTIVKKYAKSDSRIKIVNNPKNRGLGGARNAGLEVANGEYIIFVDTDDMLKPDMVQKLYNNLIENNSDMAFCDVMLLGNDLTQKPYKPFHNPNLSKNSIFYPQKQIQDFTNMWPSAWNKIYKKSIIDNNNLKYHENILYEDHTFFYEYLFSSNKVSYLPEPLYIYRNERKDSIMKESSPRIFEIFTILSYISEIFKNNVDNDTYDSVMPKIAVRLLWERTWNISGKIKKKFIKESRIFLKRYKRQAIFNNKDSFIKDDEEILLDNFKRFLSHIFHVKRNDIRISIYILGLKLKLKNPSNK